ncbi:MAG TPA: hypothetical protein VK492_03035 [Chitinophagaceae bacterium]|nr:hypothetical protein [Chitinophagaceae bacterium]
MDTPEHDNSEFANNVYKNMMDLFFNPEINRRKEQNLLPENFTLLAAQAIFFPDGRPHIVRLNEEISVEVKLKKGVDPNVNNFWASTYEVEQIKLNESEFLNCGHSTLILFKDGFQLAFDFHYNKQLSYEHLTVAKEFLKTSKFALDHDLGLAFIDNCFSAIELLAKTNLFLEANQNVYGKTNHRTIKSAFNFRYKNSQSDFEIERRQVFNQLSDVRTKARYLEGSIYITKGQLQAIYNTVDKMYNELCERARFNNN